MRKLVMLGLLILSAGLKAQTPISNQFFGQNAWMPDTIGTTVYYGQLHNKWPEVAASGTQIVRFGGIGPDKHMPTKHQYLKMVDKIRNHGMEPMLQVPFYNNTYTAAQAAEIVRYINVEKGRNVKYWVIANEPDNEYGYTTAAQVATYLRSFSFAMKDVDPTIKVIGPETAWYNMPIINGLTTPGGPDDVTGKDSKGRWILDIVSFHAYPFNGTQTRAQVLTDLVQPWRFKENLIALNQRVANCNQQHGRSGTNAIKVAVTEANVGYVNSATDNLNGTGANSFIGAQFWVEMMGIALEQGVEMLTFWSVVEGNNTVYNMGFIDYTNGKKKPTYHHFKMMAEHFSGTMNQVSDNQANVKVFSSKNSTSVVVMIMNQDLSTSMPYVVTLNNTTSSESDPLKIKVDAGVNSSYHGEVTSQATQLLVFDLNGSLQKKMEYRLNGHADANLPPEVYEGSPTDVSEEQLEKNLNVFPNPTTGSFTVEIQSIDGFTDDIPFQVINELGQTVISQKIQPKNGKVSEKIEPTADLASGIYFVSLEIDKKRIIRKLVIRN